MTERLRRVQRCPSGDLLLAFAVITTSVENTQASSYQINLYIELRLSHLNAWIHCDCACQGSEQASGELWLRQHKQPRVTNLVYGPRPQWSTCQAPLSKTVTLKESLYYQRTHLGAVNQARSALCNINASSVRLPMKGTAIHARKQYVFCKWTSSKLMFIWVWGQSQHISQVTNKDSLKVFIHSRVKQHFHVFGLRYEASSNDTVFHSWICINLGLWAASLWGFNDYNCTCGTISEVSKMNAVTPQGFNH